MIENVELFNWKSFEHQNISFVKGINFITGKNGVGKSSILQAICVAFTGQTPDGIALKDFIRRGAQSTQLIIKFRKNNELLTIERNFSMKGKEKCFLFNEQNHKLFGGSWDSLSEYIEENLDIRRPLFNRLFYLSEGDVYRSIEEPPGRQLLDEIDKLMGISQLQSLEKVVKQRKNFYSDEIDRHSETLKIVETNLQTFVNIPELQNKLAEAQKTKEKTNTELGNKSAEIWRLRDELKRLEEQYQDIEIIALEETELLAAKEKSRAAQNTISSLANQIEVTKAQRLAVEARLINLQKILEVVNSEGTSVPATNCPICKKPLLPNEMRQIREELIKDRELEEHSYKNLSDQLSEFERSKDNNLLEVSTVNDKLKKVDFLKAKYRDQESNSDIIAQKISNLKERISIYENELRELTTVINTTDAQIGDLREQIGRFSSVEKYRDLGQAPVIEDLKTASRGEYISEFLLIAIEKLLVEQRNSKLKNRLYADVSKVWNSIKGGEHWEITLDKTALPSVNKDSQEYSFPLLSAGEKTSLFVVTRTLLGALFTKTVDFLLLDEPLEHLDARNRHSLLQFLADATAKGIVNQMIITTTEDYLTRRFADYGQNKIIPLEALLLT